MPVASGEKEHKSNVRRFSCGDCSRSVAPPQHLSLEPLQSFAVARLNDRVADKPDPRRCSTIRYAEKSVENSDPQRRSASPRKRPFKPALMAPIVAGRLQRACTPRRRRSAGTPRCRARGAAARARWSKPPAERPRDRPKQQPAGLQTVDPITLFGREWVYPDLAKPFSISKRRDTSTVRCVALHDGTHLKPRTSPNWPIALHKISQVHSGVDAF